MQKVCERQIKYFDELRSLRILTSWDELDQCVIDTAVRQGVAHVFVEALQTTTLTVTY